MIEDSPRTTIDEAIARVVREEMAKIQLRRKRVLELDEAAEYLGVSEGTIYNLMSSGKLRRVGLDRKHRFDIDDLDSLIQESKQQI